MNLNEPLLPLGLSIQFVALSTVALAFFTWRRLKSSRLTGPFMWFTAGIAVWTIAYSLEILATHVPTKVFWGSVVYAGIGLVTPAYLAYCLHFTNHERWITHATLTALWLEPLFTMALVVTNPIHHLVWGHAAAEPVSRYGVLNYSYGPWFYINFTYNSMLIIFSSLMLLDYMLHTPKAYRMQFTAVIFGAFAPVAAGVLNIAGLNPFAPLDIAPLAFLLTDASFAWAIFRSHLINIVPIAREMLIENLRDGVVVLDTRYVVVDVNPAAEGILKVKAIEAIGMPALQLLRIPADHEGPGLFPSELRLGQSNDLRPYELTQSSLYNQSKTHVGWVLQLRDITERKALEAAVMSSELKYRKVVDHANDGITIVCKQRVAFCNPQLAAMLGYSVEEMIDTPFSLYVATERQPEMFNRYLTLRAHDTAPFRHETILVTKTGVQLYVDMNASRMEYHGQPSNLIFVRDITDRKRIEEVLRESEAKFRRLANLDSLTELTNHRHFLNLSDAEFKRARRYDQPLSLAILDIDHFKQVNDHHGHTVGDQVLVQLSRLFQASLREVDVLGRYGGEEFVFLMPETGLEQAHQAAERICQQVRATPFETDRGPVKVTVSMGVASLRPSDQSFEDLLVRADQALYAAKAAGRDRVWAEVVS